MKWAIITGASSGIGKALAFEFAAGGFSLFLTGRNETALREIAAACAQQPGVNTETFVADLGCPDAIGALLEAITSKPRDYEVLVNNAGFGIHGDFATTDIDKDVQLLNVQLTAALKLTRSLLPLMIKRGKGRILNVASVYSFSPVPFQSVYAACKAFLWSFSSSLQHELQGTGVTVTIFCPGVTQTEFRSRAGIAQRRTDTGLTAEEAARIAYKETLRGTHLVVPGFVNRLFVIVMRRLPVSVVPKLMGIINRQRGQG
jgi:short-subunit dehydrogenase